MRPLTFQILRELSDANFTSGTALAKKLAVSRSAVSDALMQASASGVEIFKLTRRGYKLAAPLDMLDSEKIQQHLGCDVTGLNIEVLDTIDSTNTELKRRLGRGQLSSGTCITAEIQTDGHGRRGRPWHSGFGTSLTFSLLWRFEKGAAQLGGLSLVVGLVIAKLLRIICIAGASVKWPNDLLAGHKKLGGVLIETQGDMLGPTIAVIGIGINVKLPEIMKRAIDQPVTDLVAHSDMLMSRNQLLATILQALVPELDKFNKHGFLAFRDEWLAYHAYQDCTVSVVQGDGKSFEAVVSGVAIDGSLLVKPIGLAGRHEKEIALSSAEISVRVIEQNNAKPTFKQTRL